MQEAVQARLHPSGQAKECQAELMRVLRVGSLMHGLPEDVPVEGQTPLLLGPKSGPEASRARVTWNLGDMDIDIPADALEICTLHLTRCGQLLRHNAEKIYVLQGPQLTEWQHQMHAAEVVPSGEEDAMAAESRTVLQIVELVAAAIATGDPVIFRDARAPNMGPPVWDPPLVPYTGPYGY